MIDLNIRILSMSEYPLWDELVIKSPHGTTFHTSSWITKNAEIFLTKEILFGCFINENLVAGCQIYSDKKYHLISTGISNLPMTPYGGFVLSLPQNFMCRKLEKTHNNYISALNNELIKKFDYINIINSPELSDIRQFIWTGWKPSIYYAYHVNLNDHSEKNLSRNILRFNRKAKKLGITVKKEFDPNLFFELYKTTFNRKLLNTPLSKNRLSKMMDMIIEKNMGEMWIAKTLHGEPAAAEIIIGDTKLAHRWSAASDSQFNHTGAAILLLTEIFYDLKKRGFQEINCMSANTPELTNFITAFNPRLKPYYGVEFNKYLG